MTSVTNTISNTMSKRRIKNFLTLLLLIGLIKIFGLHTLLFEKNIEAGFDYPLSENIYPYVEQLRNNDKPSVAPINVYNYTFISSCNDKCDSEAEVRLAIIVKSALHNFDNRMAIRNTWGFENRFSDVTIRKVFVLGISDKLDKSLQESVDAESNKYNDIVQANFHDSYFNNTIKTMMGFTWAMKFCPKAKFYFFSDDDMYVSIKNVLRFIRNPSHYPEYVEEALAARRKLNLNNIQPKVLSKSIYSGKTWPESNHFLISSQDNRKKINRRKRQAHFNYELPDDAILYAGFVFRSSPHRHLTSKWYISLDEYQWNKWPPYVSAGAYVISQEALISMYYASHFVKHFRFDDIYLGILAKKMAIEPFHCKEVYFYKKDYNVHNYRYVVASHGYGNTEELISVWNEQKAAGNA